MSKNLLNLLLIVTAFAVYYLVINPLYTGVGSVWQPSSSIKSLKDMNVQYDTTLAQADGLYNQAQTLKAQYTNISPTQKEKMELMVPNSIDKIRLLDEVQGVGKERGLYLENLSYSEGGTNIGALTLGSVGVSFTVKTSYPKFKELMDDFEKSLRLFSIQSVSFSSPEKEGDLFLFQVKLITYYLK
ncbi:MAG: type 4a pilus biogenesis protein PilO [Candidatus Paceibacterota bacterium]